MDANMTAAEFKDEHFAAHLAKFEDDYLDTSQPDMAPPDQASLPVLLTPMRIVTPRHPPPTH
ncbi:TPA: hypothetical protein ACH3X2_011227 [Trebouxia sp. C0005]